MKTLTALLVTLCLGAPAVLHAQVLDDYSSDVNFSLGRYTFVEVFGSPGNDPQVSDGELKINTFNGSSTFATAAFLWNDGPQLSSVGDRVSIEVRFDGGPISAGSTHVGLWLSDTLDGGGVNQEVNMGQSGGGSYLMQLVGITTINLDGVPVGNALLAVDVTDVTESSMGLMVSLSGNGFTPVSQAFTMNTTTLYFGPVAFDTDGTNGVHDNLTYISAPDVLDNYLTDQNFVDGLYTFKPITGSPANDPQVIAGELRVNTQDGNNDGTAAFLWNQGQQLRNVGDIATVDIRFDVEGNEFATAGLQLSDTLGPGGTNRGIYLYVDSSDLIFTVGFDDYFLSGDPSEPSTLTVEATAIFENSLQLQTRLTGGVSGPLVSFSVPVREAYFGPVAGFTDGTMVFHDNLDYTAGQIACLGNLDGDESVGTLDLLDLLGFWGPCVGCAADLNDDGQVGTLDLLLLLGAWGPCPGDACCLPDHTCIIATATDCAAGGGTYQGEGSTCDVQFCGVCCFVGKNEDSCTFADVYYVPDTCNAIGGYFLGECTYCGGFCDFVDWGSCCLKDGSCVETSPSDCFDMNGEFNSALSCDCAECIPAPTGACCDGSFFNCSIVTEFECQMQDGFYMGDGTTCQPGTGACCIEESFCIDDATEECCTIWGEIYLGDGSECAPGEQCP